MHVDCASSTEIVIAPDLLKKLRSGEYTAGVLCEVLKELELFKC